jgi:protein disulfide-isomerase A1
LAPIWEELGSNLPTDHIVIAKMDATANDLPLDVPFQLQGFPTLKLIKATTNEIVDYEGDRSLESLTAFLKENAVHGEDVVVVESQDTQETEEEEEDEHDEL